MTEAEARAAGGRIETAREPFADNDRAVTEAATEGFIKVIRRNGRVVGACIVGTGCWRAGRALGAHYPEIEGFALDACADHPAVPHALGNLQGRRVRALRTGCVLAGCAHLGAIPRPLAPL